MPKITEELQNATVLVIGLGLIGGSLALEMKKRLSAHVIGVDNNESHAQKAMDLKIIDTVGTVEDASKSDIVIIAVPVNFASEVVNRVLNNVAKKTLVFDASSTKEAIGNTVKEHQNRGNFVSAHPMAGTEYSGPEAALYDLFDEKIMIICEKEQSNAAMLQKAIAVFEVLQMKIIFMNAKKHDKHIAYVSHLSHISSFMLGKTVLEKEKKEKNIFHMAGSGFSSTVRLAKSSPKMWAPIFIQNKENVLHSLDDYIQNLQAFRADIAAEDTQALEKTMAETNRIKETLEGIK